MTEAFLHHIWQHQLFNAKKITTTKGLAIEILKPGEYNSHAGPDFFSAQIRINGTLWVGTVEIHVRASEWTKHKHDQDAAYDNCILHVVLECDEDVFRKNGEEIFCLELKGLFSDQVWKNYEILIGTYSWIPCSHRIREIEPMLLNSWLDRLAVERLERKTYQLIELLETNNNDWDETFYQFLSAGFGFQINALPFTILSRHVSYRMLQRFRNKPIQLEALLFGCAGYLNQPVFDDYSLTLKEEFEHFQKAFNLSVMDVSCWKFLRLRPVNFPTIRISQLSSLISNTDRLFSQILELKTLDSARQLFNVSASKYWDDHYTFAKVSKGIPKHLGYRSIDNLFINVVIPLLFAYGIRNDSVLHREKALSFLEQIPSEDNSIIRKWKEEGIKSQW